MKRCGTCNRGLPRSAFYVRQASLDGLAHKCKACAKRAALEWHRRNYVPRPRAPGRGRSEAAVEAGRKRWIERNPERAAESARRRSRAWRQRNPDQVKAMKRERRFRERGAPLTACGREYVNVLAGDPCSYCGGPADTIDHVDPLARGGDGDWDNLTAACARCNSKKYERPLLEFLLARST